VLCSECELERLTDFEIQDVHKFSLQFQKFITKTSEKTDTWKLLQNETYIFKVHFD
jgi:hypothetical protein